MARWIFMAFLFIGTLSRQSFAQQVEWASKVLEASSEFSSTEYSASQILGRPNVAPGEGDSPSAWMPFRNDREEYIKVGFDNPIPIRQIAVAESLNPGAIYQIYVYDKSGNEFLINTFEPKPVGLKSRMLHVFFDLTDYEVAAVKIVLHGGAVPGNNAIDAVAISDSTTPVEQEVQVSQSEIVNVHPEKLSATVNSVYNELKPLVAPDGKTLFFSRQYHPGNIGGASDPEDIWYSQWDEKKGDWQEAENMGPPLNTQGPNFISSITPDGNTVIVTLGNRYTKNGKMKAGVSVSTRNSEGWTRPVPFDIINDVNTAQQANYFLANNRETLLISEEGYPTQGKRDLYVSFLREDGRWSEPLNLGPSVNTVKEESCPFLAADDKTLYFSSDGYTGYGKHDIYVTRRLDSTWTKWSEPENLGPEINSKEDDAFFNIPPTGEYGYFSRDFNSKNSDIYRFQLPGVHQPEPVVTVRGTVYNSKTRRPVEAVIHYESLPDGKEIGKVDSDPTTGAYQIILPSGSQYGLRAEADDFASVNANIDLNDNKKYGEVHQDLFLVPIEKGAVVRLNNLFFDVNEYKLKEGSFPELNRVVEILKKQPDMKMEIGGYTDNIGKPEYNQQLSERRAKAIMEYLVKDGGIDPSRLTAKGYGETNPIASNANESGRAQNRRVEFKILEE